MSYNISEIVSNFCIEGNVAAIIPYGSGHINDTFHLKNANPGLPGYLLQRINHHVFENVPALMKNVQLVTDHLKEKLTGIPGSNPDKEVLTIVSAKDKQCFFCDETGNYWRMYCFLKDTKSYDMVLTEQQAYEGGKAFGKFQLLLSDLDSGLLYETIPGFHNITMRLDRLNKAVLDDPKNRIKDVLTELSFIIERADQMATIMNLGKEGKLPLRIIHNDTKFNNILLDMNDHEQCVIDLDTVMPGYVAYDFGDAIRTIINTAPEDEQDVTKIELNIPLFKAYAAGYFEYAGSFLSDTEVKSLSMGVLLIPYMQGVRFLTDYIEGDVYYKIHSPEHNLQRARAQFELLSKLEKNYDVFDQIIHNTAKKYIQITTEIK
ncbi:phosphotransferase enzyme family protein [Mucilaginibacter sp. P25]|uniref:Ser/Thr protein kinase RdoA involved in Cpx stress response, MazF antagonist n=1 Tax=Mucilaginibacter gossypii TaxID=551996 RepID=A0A1G7S736_9SPHI|nr:aminoglycoside phosphotransferase family protein [Mucilaginibacter gossypii]SDG18846.1 Ser/Thr protein kinase RdoA involved in Cpx stress response, MazF antagonist [Mucilaginibacter gossypii]